MDRDTTTGAYGNGHRSSLSDTLPLYRSLGDNLHTPKTNRRSLDAPAFRPQLSPSPKFREPALKPSDVELPDGTPSRAPSKGPANSLFLQMPTVERQGSTSSESYSPQTDNKDNYGSPTTVLPRHSRGMDFARARTNMHHSTLPDKSTPDSSPIFTHKAMRIPSRRSSTVSNMWESPRPSLMHGLSVGSSSEKFRPRSIGSTTAMTSDASDSSSSDDDNCSRREDGDEMVTTPQMHRQQGDMSFTPYGMREGSAPGSIGHLSSPIDRRFHPFRRNRAGRNTGRLQGLRRLNVQRAIDESQMQPMADAGDADPMESPSRQESSATLDALRVTTSTDSGDESGPRIQPSSPGVVRRPVTRRSNLLPKTKGFARIRAALQEESAPVDTDFKREAEVVRQVRVKDPVPLSRVISTASSSPDLTPNTASIPADASDLSDIDGLGLSQPSDLPRSKPPDDRRGSVNREFWPHLYNRLETPTLPIFNRPRSSSGISEDMRLDSPAAYTPVSNGQSSATSARLDTKLESEIDSGPFQLPNMPSAADISRKINKRRRDDDFDPASFKRRAVSPGMSSQNSPIRGQSPVLGAGGWWSQPKALRQDSGGAMSEDRSGSMSSTGLTTPAVGPMTPSLGPKRIGTAAQTNMFDTNDGLTKMTLE